MLLTKRDVDVILCVSVFTHTPRVRESKIDTLTHTHRDIYVVCIFTRTKHLTYTQTHTHKQSQSNTFFLTVDLAFYITNNTYDVYILNSLKLNFPEVVHWMVINATM